MAEGDIILTFRILEAKTEPCTARLYHITAKSAMAEEDIILTFRILEAKTEQLCVYIARIRLSAYDMRMIRSLLHI